MESDLLYRTFLIKLPMLCEKELYQYIQQSLCRLDKDSIFSLCFHCKKVNPTLFPIFFITLTRMFPLSALQLHVHNIAWLSTFQWSDYINILTELTERGLIQEDVSIYGTLYSTIIRILADQLYTERYYIQTVSNLGLYLPREGKSLDKKTRIVKKLAFAYYNLYVDRNKPEDDWEDVDHIFNMKNKAMKLYRRDVSNLSQRFKEQNGFE